MTDLGESTAAPLTVQLRDANSRDLPALSALVLTSYRQFELFDFLYSPLRQDINIARDTIWYWNRRLNVVMLDTTAKLVVATVKTKYARDQILGELPDDDKSKQSREMLEWVHRECGGTDPQEIHGHGQHNNSEYIVGFAIWQVRGATSVNDKDKNLREKSWASWFKTTVINQELKFWNSVYQRRDQNREAYAAYLETEEKLEERLYSQDSVYYLDNLTVDFRFHRKGIGRRLVRAGMDSAKMLNLDAMTEASQKGRFLYQSLGFSTIDTWEVCGMVFPVMKWSHTSHDG